MSTIGRVDPELGIFLETVSTFDVDAGNLQALREMDLTPPEPVEKGVSMERRTIAGPAGAPDLRALIFRRGEVGDAGGKLPAVLWIHGGGYIMGSPETTASHPRMLAGNLNCVVVSPSYRLAPETKWPGAVEDLYAVLCWMHDNADELGIDTDRIAVYGESAGGGHAAALTLHARDRGGPNICFQLLVYPMLDDRYPKDNPASGEFSWTRASDQFGWSSLLGVPAGSDDVPPGSVPARVEDLSGLPPAFICTAELDLFVDENLVYANRLSRAGVPTGLYMAPRVTHGFYHFMPEASASRQFTALILSELDAAFAPARPAASSLASVEGASPSSSE